MRPPSPVLAPWALLLLPFLSACGGDEGGGGATRPSAGDLLGALHARVASGEGISDATWSDDVQAVAMALWPARGPDRATIRRTHTDLAHIAGDMAVHLLAGPVEARADWARQDPSSLAIHDGFLEASGRGVEAYRNWVEGEGARLREERIRRLREGDE